MPNGTLNYLPLIISCVIGLNMLWTEIMRGKNSRRQAGTLDQTTLEGKHIDDSIAWRKDILDENKTLRTDLSAANKLIAELSITHATLIRTILDKSEEIVGSTKLATELVKRNNDILEKWLSLNPLKANQ